jgi:DNA-binding GntR family transcriptional regulator
MQKKMVEPAPDAPASSVDRIYRAVKEMAISYRFKPGERINEGALARRLGTSRTPAREALNRLVAEGFLTFERGRGFFCRAFKPREIFELYQLRSVIEAAAARLACEQASEAELDRLARFLDQTGPDDRGRSSAALVTLDEHFHESIMALTRNAEMARVLANVNARIKFFRWIDMDTRRIETQHEHRAILAALRARDAACAARRMEAHISHRLDRITAAIKEGYSRIYVDA